MSCGRKLGIPLKLQWESQGTFRVASGESVARGNSVFLSSCDRDLEAPIELQQGSQALSRVEAWNSTFLSSCKRGVRPPVELRYVSGPISRGATELSVLHSCRELIPRVTFQSWQGMRPYFEWTGTSGSFRMVTRPLEFLSSLKVRPASP